VSRSRRREVLRRTEAQVLLADAAVVGLHEFSQREGCGLRFLPRQPGNGVDQVLPRSGKPVELRAFLEADGSVLSETWSHALLPEDLR
jgi:glucan biosynthesis protein